MANKRYQRNLGVMGNIFWIETAISTCNEETQIASPMTELARRADALGARIAGHKIVIHNRCDRSRLEIGGDGTGLQSLKKVMFKLPVCDFSMSGNLCQALVIGFSKNRSKFLEYLSTKNLS